MRQQGLPVLYGLRKEGLRDHVFRLVPCKLGMSIYPKSEAIEYLDEAAVAKAFIISNMSDLAHHFSVTQIESQDKGSGPLQ